MPDYEEIKKHWDSLSKNEDSYKASWDDFYMVQKEIEEISSHLRGDEEICDIGCNNGYCDFQLLSLFKDLKIVGIDYAEQLIANANERLKRSAYQDRAGFLTGNILDAHTFPEKKFDIVLIKRVLINLTDERDQMQALVNVTRLLKENGKIILTEAVDENAERLNRLRREFSLDGLKPPWHNKYLNENVIQFMYSHFNVECDHDYSSSYYIFSRVFHPWMKKVNGDASLEYLSEFNRMAASVPNFGDYGTQRLFILSQK
jgi:ubiquinone/menaquinone biosynthesis C-methylase UbiE